MKHLGTRSHGFIDYLLGILLLCSPWLMKFNDGTEAQYIPMAVGFYYIILSFLTSYDAGIVKIVPMKIHLILDVVVGAFLAASPWIFAFSSKVYLPHLILGIIGICVTLLTGKVSEKKVAIKETTPAH